MLRFVWKPHAVALGAACVLGSLALGAGIAWAQTSPETGPPTAARAGVPTDPPSSPQADPHVGAGRSPDGPRAGEAAGIRVIGENPQHEPRMSTAQIAAVAGAAGYPHVSKIEREHGLYEVRARDERGRDFEIWIDPKTGGLVLDPQTGKPLSKAIREGRSPSQPLSVEEIEAVVKAAGYVEVYGLEYEHALYEVKARDAQGRNVELFVHPRTGKLIRHRRSGEPLTEDIDD
jgi:uncharacterized protein YpmB